MYFTPPRPLPIIPLLAGEGYSDTKIPFLLKGERSKILIKRKARVCHATTPGTIPLE